MLLWTSEAVQSDQAFASFKILLPPFCKKRHGCKVGAVRELDGFLGGGLRPCLRHGHPLCEREFLSLSPSCPCLLSSDFSEVVDLFTSCTVPLPPFPPELEKAGVTWLCLKWQRPSSSPKEDDIYYTLEMEEEGSVCLFFLILGGFLVFLAADLLGKIEKSINDTAEPATRALSDAALCELSLIFSSPSVSMK